jgi:hypothetical protein
MGIIQVIRWHPFVKPAPGRQQTQPNVELESQEGQRKTQASRDSQHEEQWNAMAQIKTIIVLGQELMLILSYLPFTPTLQR